VGPGVHIMVPRVQQLVQQQAGMRVRRVTCLLPGSCRLHDCWAGCMYGRGSQTVSTEPAPIVQDTLCCFGSGRMLAPTVPQHKKHMPLMCAWRLVPSTTSSKCISVGKFVDESVLLQRLSSSARHISGNDNLGLRNCEVHA
jgi:hypothetical protein